MKSHFTDPVKHLHLEYPFIVLRDAFKSLIREKQERMLQEA